MHNAGHSAEGTQHRALSTGRSTGRSTGCSIGRSTGRSIGCSTGRSTGRSTALRRYVAACRWSGRARCFSPLAPPCMVWAVHPSRHKVACPMQRHVLPAWAPPTHHIGPCTVRCSSGGVGCRGRCGAAQGRPAGGPLGRRPGAWTIMTPMPPMPGNDPLPLCPAPIPPCPHAPMPPCREMTV